MFIYIFVHIYLHILYKHIYIYLCLRVGEKNISNAIAIAIINQFTKCHNRLFEKKNMLGF